MKTLTLFLILFAFIVAGCGPSADSENVPGDVDTSGVETSPMEPMDTSAVDTAAVDTMAVGDTDDSVVYVDVRTPEEYAEGHVEGAILIPHDQMDERWTELESYKDQTVVLYCRSGRRSAMAEEVLREKGFTNLQNAGGFDDLRSEGLPVATGNAG